MLLLKDVANQSIFSLLEKPKRARSLSPKRLSKSTNKIPKVAPKKKPPPPPPPPPAAPQVAQATSEEDEVRGFSSEFESDVPEESADDYSYSDSDSDENEKPAKRKRHDSSEAEMSEDDSLLDGEFSMFNPSATKTVKLTPAQSTHVHKMFSQLIKAEDMEDSFEALGLKKSSDPFLQVKELDSELLDAIPGASYLSKADKSLTAIEGRVLRAATPALSLWGELQSCRNSKKGKADVNRLITLAEAVVCGIGQALVETKFQRRLAVTSKILKDRKKAKAVLHQNDTVLDKEKKFLFGQAFTKKLVKRLSRTKT